MIKLSTIVIKIIKNFSHIFFFSDYNSLNNISTSKEKKGFPNGLHNCFVLNSKRTKFRKVCGCRIALALIFAFFKFKLGISLIEMSLEGDQWELIYFLNQQMILKQKEKQKVCEQWEKQAKVSEQKEKQTLWL